MTRSQEQTQSTAARWGRTRVLPGLLAVLFSVSLAGVAFAGPALDPERRAGDRAARAVEARFGRLADAKRLGRVDAVARRLAVAAGKEPGFISFRLLDSSDYNALALPGGVIYVMRGLVDGAGSDDELAAALAHEMSHILLGHTREILEEEPPRHRVAFVVESAGRDGKASRQVLPADTAAEERRAHERELEADRAALPLLAKAGFRPAALLDVLGRLHQGENLKRAAAALAPSKSGPGSAATSHPKAAERIRRAKLALASL